MREEFEHLTFLMEELFRCRQNSSGGNIVLPWSGLVIPYAPMKWYLSPALRIKPDEGYDLPSSAEQILYMVSHSGHNKECPAEDVVQLSFQPPLRLWNHQAIERVDLFDYRVGKSALQVYDPQGNECLFVIRGGKIVLLFSVYDPDRQKTIESALQVFKGLEALIC